MRGERSWEILARERDGGGKNAGSIARLLGVPNLHTKVGFGGFRLTSQRKLFIDPGSATATEAVANALDCGQHFHPRCARKNRLDGARRHPSLAPAIEPEALLELSLRVVLGDEVEHARAIDHRERARHTQARSAAIELMAPRNESETEIDLALRLVRGRRGAVDELAAHEHAGPGESHACTHRLRNPRIHEEALVVAQDHRQSAGMPASGAGEASVDKRIDAKRRERIETVQQAGGNVAFEGFR